PEIVIGKRRQKSKAHPVPGFIEHRVDIDPLGEKRDPDRPEHIPVKGKRIGTGCVQGIIRKYEFLREIADRRRPYEKYFLSGVFGIRPRSDDAVLFKSLEMNRDRGLCPPGKTDDLVKRDLFC